MAKTDGVARIIALAALGKNGGGSTGGGNDSIPTLYIYTNMKNNDIGFKSYGSTDEPTITLNEFLKNKIPFFNIMLVYNSNSTYSGTNVIMYPNWKPTDNIYDGTRGNLRFYSDVYYTPRADNNIGQGIQVVVDTDLQKDDNGNVYVTFFRINVSTLNYLSKKNTSPYTPTGDYNPATKKYVDDNKYTLPVASTDTLGGIKIGENLSIDENGVVSASNKSVPVYFIENESGGNGYLINYSGLVGKTSECTEILNDVATKGSSSFIISCYSTSSTNGRAASGILYQAYKFTLSKSGGFIKLGGFFYGRSPTSPYRPEFNVHNVQILYSYNSSNNKYNCTEVKSLSNDKITVPLASDVLMKTNTTSYTPTSDYNPATKKYVDDAITTAITTSLEGSY